MGTEEVDATVELFDGQTFILPADQLDTYFEKNIDLPISYNDWVVKILLGAYEDGNRDNFYFTVRIRNLNGDVVWESDEIFALEGDNNEGITYVYLPADFDWGAIYYIEPEVQTYTVEPIISSRPDRTAWAWIFKEDIRNKLINSTDPSEVSITAYMSIREMDEIVATLTASNTLDNGVLCVDEGSNHLNLTLIHI